MNKILEPVIYRFTFPNSKYYIGQTVNFRRRITMHKQSSKKEDTKLYRATRKYGWNNIVIDKIWSLPPSDLYNYSEVKQLLNDLEVHYIDKYNSFRKGYNSTTGGDSNTIYSEETRIKLSKIHKGRRKSLETRKRMSEAFKGRIVTNETKEKISNTLKGNELSDETKNIISQKGKGRLMTEEHKQRIIKANSKSVVQLDENNNVVLKFETTQEAADYFGENRKYLVMQINGNKRNKYNLFYNLTYIVQLDSNNKVIRRFNNADEAAKYFGYKDAGTIRKHLNGTTNNKHNLQYKLTYE